jgi:gas vesicle protein
MFRFDRFLNTFGFTMIMDSKSVLSGLLIGLLIGAAGVFFINQSNISRLNSQITALEDQAEYLDEVIQIKQNLLDSQQDIIDVVEELEAQANITQGQLEVYEVYKQNADALIEELNFEITILNKLAAKQTYSAEDPTYVSEINFLGVFGNLSFEEWWELNKGPYEEWMSLVYT